MIRVFVAGLESSGNHWIRSVLKHHPGLLVTGDSFPSDWCERRHYPQVEPHDVLVIAARDRTAHRASVVRMGYEKDTEGKFPDEKSLELIASAATKSPKVVFASYETALLYRQAYWDFLFRCIGVDPVTVETEYKDGNVKYFK